jgi:hypothetical protein
LLLEHCGISFKINENSNLLEKLNFSFFKGVPFDLLEDLPFDLLLKNQARPKSRWADGVNSDSLSLGVRDWTHCAQDRQSWKDLLGQARRRNFKHDFS